MFSYSYVELPHKIRYRTVKSVVQKSIALFCALKKEKNVSPEKMKEFKCALIDDTSQYHDSENKSYY